MHDSSISYFQRLLSPTSGDSGVALLRLKSAPFILSFLYKEFREHHNQTVLNSQMTDDLIIALRNNDENSDEQKNLDEEFKDEGEQFFSDIRSKANSYINKWSGEKYKFLSRDIDAGGRAYLQLNTSIEKLLNWIESLEPKEFVGTQSRFMSVLNEIRTLDFNISESPAERISELEKRKKQIEEEIKKIKETNYVEAMNAVLVRETLFHIRQNSQELLSDFKSVEDNFREISKVIYKTQSEQNATKGKVLGYTLDAEKKLRDSPQGQSFFTFWNFILQDSNEEIQTKLNRILSFLEKKGEAYSDNLLPNLKRFLYEHGSRIVLGNRDLSERISRVLEFQDTEEKRNISKAIKEVLSLAANIQQDENFLRDLNKEISMSIESKADVFLNRYPVVQEHKMNYSKINTESSEEEIPIDFIYNQFFVDEKSLKQNAVEFKKFVSRQFTLGELTQKFPVQKGLSEIVAWIKIADENSIDKIRCQILEDETEEIEYEKEDVIVKITTPKVVFL